MTLAVTAGLEYDSNHAALKNGQTIVVTSSSKKSRPGEKTSCGSRGPDRTRMHLWRSKIQVSWGACPQTSLDGALRKLHPGRIDSTEPPSKFLDPPLKCCVCVCARACKLILILYFCLLWVFYQNYVRACVRVCVWYVLTAFSVFLSVVGFLQSNLCVYVCVCVVYAYNFFCDFVCCGSSPIKIT